MRDRVNMTVTIGAEICI